MFERLLGNLVRIVVRNELESIRNELQGIRNELKGMVREQVTEQIHAMLALTGPQSRPNINPLWRTTRNVDAIQLNLKFFGYEVARNLAAALPAVMALHPERVSLRSKPATQADMESGWAAFWLAELKVPLMFHRKLWEYVFLLQALWEAGMLEPGRRGLGFGCGREPLPSYFASRNVQVCVTDLAPEETVGRGWQETAQHAATLDVAFHAHLVPRDVFDRQVRLEHVDMNAIPDHLRDFDFAWSICALEHLGSIEKGLAFIENSLATVRSGGVVVHTTEFNFTRDDETIDNWITVLFQRRHFQELAIRLQDKGHHVAPLDFHVGNDPMDHFIDLPPFRDDWSSGMREFWAGNTPHLKLNIDGFPTTCFGLIITRG